MKGATIYKVYEFAGAYLIQTLLVLNVIIFAVLSEDQLHHVLIKHLIPASPLRVGPDDSLVLQITHGCSDFFIIQDEIRSLTLEAELIEIHLGNLALMVVVFTSSRVRLLVATALLKSGP